MNVWSGQTIRLVFEANDRGRDSLLEVGNDDVRAAPPEPQVANLVNPSSLHSSLPTA
jgi:hypothetical protein